MAVGSKLIGIATGIVVRKVSMQVLDKVWRKTKHTEPPADPASPGTPWMEALLWAAGQRDRRRRRPARDHQGRRHRQAEADRQGPKGMEGPAPKGTKR
jgi:hypothetical protein